MKIAFITFLSVLAIASVYGKDNYQVRESGNAIELETPYGNKTLYGNFLPEGTQDYRIEIPIDELKSALPQPITTPAPAILLPAAESKKEIVIVNPETPKPTLPPKVVVEYDDSDRFVIEANRLYNRGKFYEATLQVEELLRRKPEYTRAWIMKGSLMHVQGHKDLAKTAWATALKLDPSNKEIKGLLEKYR
ncbi:MAG: hypothetical protein HY537_09725 [Deltaproteobacteria bacterium]|nr:hypothetical protein [Deltaproteobacteria bacterium]